MMLTVTPGKPAPKPVKPKEIKFLTVVILILIAVVSCRSSAQVCGFSSSASFLVYSISIFHTDTIKYEGLPAFHKSKTQICATTTMRDSVIISGKDTTTIINMPPTR
jgi:hypothetical protein